MKRLGILALAFLITVSLGCKNDDKSTPQKQAQSIEKNDQVTVVAPQSQTGIRSPAIDVSTQKLTVDTAPEIVCEKFVAAIREGNNQVWEKLLTQLAERHIRAANLQMQIPGGSQSSCSVGKATYNSVRQDIALVGCIVEQITEGNTQSFEISYLLRKQSVGWRIAGMIVPTEEGSTDLLSFENTDDVAQIKASTEGTEVASNPNTENQFK